MKNWKTSLYAQIVYMAGMGLGLLMMPQLLADLLQLGSAQEVWVRVLGLLALTLTSYYYNAIQQDAVWFARASVYGRAFFCAGMAITGGVFGLPILIVLAAVEAGLAVWTYWSLR